MPPDAGVASAGAPLTDVERRLVQRARHRLRAALVVGLALTAAGGLYTIWSGQQLRATAAEVEQGFDRPIARLARLTAPERERLARMQPATAREAALRDDLLARTDKLTVILVSSLRTVVGLMLLGPGLLLLVQAATQRPLLAIIARLGALPPPHA